MTVTVEVKKVLFQSETLTIFNGWYEDLSISFRCQGTLTFEPCEKDKITLQGQFHPQFGDQVFFFFSAERFVRQDIKTAIAMVEVEKDCKDIKKSQRRKVKKMNDGMSFREYYAGYVPENVRWNIPIEYYGAATRVCTVEPEKGFTSAVDDAMTMYANNNLDRKTVATYAMRVIWYRKGDSYCKHIESQFTNKWNVFHGGSFVGQSFAVSAEKACNNLRFREFRNVPDDGTWTAVACEVPWTNDLNKENKQ